MIRPSYREGRTRSDSIGVVLRYSRIYGDERGGGGPQDIVDLLNDYFERLVEVVFEYHGGDKYIGDADGALGNAIARRKPNDNAVAAAVGFRDAIRQFNAERVAEGLMPIGMGVGVNSGPLVAGYMGAKKRLEYTVIGDTVNTASRLCGLAEPDQVVISAATLSEIRDLVEVEYLEQKSEGKEQGVEAYQVLSIRPGAVPAAGEK